MMLEFDLSEIRSVSNKLIKNFNNSVIFFEGGLGVGKTTLIREICKVWEVSDFVNSPTFSIINEYVSPKVGIIYHLDLYRLNNLTELFDSGIEEYFEKGNFCLIESPGKFYEMVPVLFHRIKISEKRNGNRELELIH